VNIKNRQEHWDDIYTKNHPDEVSWYQKEPTISLKVIRRLSNNKTHIIDIGGGASVLTDCLLKLGYSNVSVLDISKKAIDHAKRRLAEQAVKVEWYVKDITDFIPSHPYDIWHDRAVFHFLVDSKSRNLYIKTLKNALRAEGYALIATFAKDGPKKCSGLDIVQYDSLSMQHELGDEFTLLEHQSEIHLTPKGNEQHFNYFLFQRNKK
jgi:2-polyprenyl-3-methyl-5-hydroxy-6-metoxy-1,4-benzoquinol methylase